MTTSYSKKIHLSKLLVYYTLDSQVSLSLSCVILSLLGVNKLRTKYPKIMRTASLGSNFTGSYKKEHFNDLNLKETES